MKEHNKKGIGPLIATVLIMGLTVALAALVMVWGPKVINDINRTEQSPEFVDGLECIEWNGSVETRIYDPKNSSSKEDLEFGITFNKISLMNLMVQGKFDAYLEDERDFGGVHNAYYVMKIIDETNDTITVIFRKGYWNETQIEGLEPSRSIITGTCVKYVKTWEKE